MIMSHMSYCLTSWASANITTLKAITTLYKQALKILDRKPKSYHHCHILKKHELMDWDNYVKYNDSVLIFKIFHGLAPPPLQTFITKSTNRATRASSRGDCSVPFRKSAFSQAVFSYRASHTWNAIPNKIRESPTLNAFSKHLKSWLLENQNCQHNT